MVSVFNRLATELEFRLSGMPVGEEHYFHGCLAESIPGVVSEGLRVNCLEPCLTPNPASALWKYSNPAAHSRNLYSGKVWDEVRAVVSRGEIGGGNSSEELLKSACHYWRDCPTIGAAFVLNLRHYRVVPIATGKIVMEGNIVHGGISKWIYAHLSVIPEAGDSSQLVVTPQCILGYLKPSNRWSTLFNTFHPLRRSTIPSLEEGYQQAYELLLREDRFDWVGSKANVLAVAQAIINGTAYGFLYQELRKLLLAFTAMKGIEILKDDFYPASSWPVADAIETYQTIGVLRRTHYTDPRLREIRDLWLTRLLQYSQTRIYEI